jgi:hypothetical protein
VDEKIGLDLKGMPHSGSEILKNRIRPPSPTRRVVLGCFGYIESIQDGCPQYERTSKVPHGGKDSLEHALKQGLQLDGYLNHDPEHITSGSCGSTPTDGRKRELSAQLRGLSCGHEDFD